MSREEYIKYRKLNLLGEVAYQYFSEFGKKININIFNQVFQPFYVSNPHINWKLLWEYYDTKFKLVLVLNKEGKILKIM